MEFQHLTDAARTVKADLLAFTTFGDPTRDPLFKALDAALDGGLSEAARAESFDGKPSQCLSLWTAGKLPAKRVLVILTEKCLPSRAPAWPACRCESSLIDSAVGASVARNWRSMSSALTLTDRLDVQSASAARLGRWLVLEVPTQV